MIYPVETKLPLVSAPSQLENNPEPVFKGLTETNFFGYALNILLAIVWFSLFIYILGAQYIPRKWDLLKINQHVNLISQGILALASLFLGGFHAHILAKDKNDTDSHKWPLVVGTVLYTIAISLVYIKYRITTVNEYFPYPFCLEN